MLYYFCHFQPLSFPIVFNFMEWPIAGQDGAARNYFKESYAKHKV